MAILRLKSAYDDLVDYTTDDNIVLYTDDVLKEFTKEFVHFSFFDQILRFKV